MAKEKPPRSLSPPPFSMRRKGRGGKNSWHIADELRAWATGRHLYLECTDRRGGSIHIALDLVAVVDALQETADQGGP